MNRAGTADWARRAVMLLALPLCCVLGNVMPYAVGLIGIAVFLTLLATGRIATAYREPLPALFLAAFVVLGVCFAITAEAPADALPVFNFTMLLLAGPFLWLLARGVRPGNAATVAWLALIGVGLALLVVAVALVLGAPRGASPTLGPIRMANTAVILGFLALDGSTRVTGRQGLWFLLGPLAAIAVVVLTVSRGPLITFACVATVAVLILMRRLPDRRAMLALGAIGVAAVLGIGATAMQSRLASTASIVGTAAAGDEVADETAHIRLSLYAAGFKAFQQSPWIGHGWDELMTSVVPFLAENEREFAELPQLHNDAIDFAVAAGTVGLAVYLLLLATPIVAAVRSPFDAQHTARLYGSGVLVAGYVGAGLTDLMFGFEFNTAVYVLIAVILIGYVRDEAPVGR